MTKADLIAGLSILLNLSKKGSKGLEKLDKETLQEIFENYKQNALNSQAAVERALEHASTSGRSKATRKNTGRP